MVNYLKIKRVTVVLLLAISFIACSNDDDAQDVVEPTNTIADFVAANQDYSSLNAALERADLKTTLAGDTEFTVFAPNNAAFDSFLSANGFASLNEVPVDVLTQVLLNHVLSGTNNSGSLSTGYVETLSTMSPGENNLSMYINVDDGVVINGVSEVTQADIAVDNGVIHAVNSVIGLPDITTFATADPSFEILVQALTREDDFNFVSVLQAQESPAPYTVFAPTNQAFADLLEEFDFADLNAIPSDVLSSVLSYHVITGANVRAGDITDNMTVSTFETGEIIINTGDAVTITDENERVSTVIATDVQATNGVIHVIDQVLVPELE